MGLRRDMISFSEMQLIFSETTGLEAKLARHGLFASGRRVLNLRKDTIYFGQLKKRFIGSSELFDVRADIFVSVLWSVAECPQTREHVKFSSCFSQQRWAKLLQWPQTSDLLETNYKQM